MNISTISITILLLIIIYPFIVYYQLKSFQTEMIQHLEKIEKLITKYKDNATKENLQKIDFERRAYNRVIRANNNKLESTVGKILAKKHGFKSRENFEFKVNS